MSWVGVEDPQPSHCMFYHTNMRDMDSRRYLLYLCYHKTKVADPYYLILSLTFAFANHGRWTSAHDRSQVICLRECKYF